LVDRTGCGVGAKENWRNWGALKTDGQTTAQFSTGYQHACL
jgi:hypothetical protein